MLIILVSFEGTDDCWIMIENCCDVIDSSSLSSETVYVRNVSQEELSISHPVKETTVSLLLGHSISRSFGFFESVYWRSNEFRILHVVVIGGFKLQKSRGSMSQNDSKWT